MVTREVAYGTLPLQQREGEWYVLLIQHRAGHWGFPKGHPEPGEEPKETAIRELVEETAIERITFLPMESITEHYDFFRDEKHVAKQVTYFPAKVEGEVVIQAEELIDFGWFALEEAVVQLTFEEAKEVGRQLMTRL